MRVLLLTPPMTQLNTPYPATAYLTGFLRSRGIDARQADPAIELVSRLFSRSGLERIKRALKKGPGQGADSVRFFLEAFNDYLATVEPVLAFLQGKDPSLAVRIASRNLVPEGPRFMSLDEEHLSWAFGALGVQDRAKYIASLYIDDLADVLREGIDPNFLLSRYGERLAASQPTFDPLENALKREPSVIDEILSELTLELIEEHKPELVALTVPFPGNVYGAFRMASAIKRRDPLIKIAMGGGYVNTELRGLKEPRVFDYVDYITLDDGERPLELLIDHLAGKVAADELLRTFVRSKSGEVVFISDTKQHDIPMRDTGTPTYDGLPLGKYLSVLEMLNPMHRLWSDARWNKATLAHGCYWKKCSFCDVTLDYIGRYEPAAADLIIDRMSSLARESGQSGFHFVDEAAPPAVLRGLSERLIERGFKFSWWGNVRFEKTFTPELTKLMGDAGCIAVSGGLEVASDRLLKLMQKGVTVEQVARVTRAFREAGIMVHAYLMYGFPTETEQETIDSLERVRQLFEHDCIQSAYWHRFSATAHSPIGRDPEKFGIKILTKPGPKFAYNDLQFEDPTPCDHDRLGVGLRKALYNYMHGIGIEEDVRAWFEDEVPRTTVPRNLIKRALASSS